MSSRRTTRPSSAADAAAGGGASRAASVTRSNHTPNSGGGRSTTGRACVDRGQGSGVSSAALASLTQERENETETETETETEKRLPAQERQLKAVAESLATMLEEMSELSAAAPASWSRRRHRDVLSLRLERDTEFCLRGGSAAGHAIRFASARSRPIFNTQRRRRLQQAPRHRRSLLRPLAARLLQGEALQMPPRSGRSRRTGDRKHWR